MSVEDVTDMEDSSGSSMKDATSTMDDEADSAATTAGTKGSSFGKGVRPKVKNLSIALTRAAMAQSLAQDAANAVSKAVGQLGSSAIQNTSKTSKLNKLGPTYVITGTTRIVTWTGTRATDLVSERRAENKIIRRLTVRPHKRNRALIKAERVAREPPKKEEEKERYIPVNAFIRMLRRGRVPGDVHAGFF